MIYVVQEGDTLYSIAERFGESVYRISYDNQIFQRSLVLGEALVILVPSIMHEVKEGETLYSIGEQYEVSVKELYRKNPYLLFQDGLITGQVITIAYTVQGEKEVAVHGYAYPFISNGVLRESLLYLNRLLVFSYGFTKEGVLIPAYDQELLAAAKELSVEAYLVLTPLNERGTFDNLLVSTLLTDKEVQERVLLELEQVVIEKEYAGVDVDFEFIFPENREEYVSFVATLGERMHKIGKKVSVAVPPKTSDDQKGLLYEGIDYAGLGQAADEVFLMTYEWGYTYSVPMAVAPIPSVRRVLDYAVSRISPQKIIMGIPNYGYDWPLPYKKGVTKAKTIGHSEAMLLASEYGASIQYDESAQTPFFTYQVDGILHEVWFEDVRSMEQKWKLVKEYDFLAGGYWNLMRYFRGNWLWLDSAYRIKDTQA